MHFDDTYNGARFTYGLNFRPLATAQVPDGWIIWSDRESKDFCFGLVDYPFKLSSDKVKSFDMTFVGKKD